MLKRLIGIALALGVANAHSIAYSAVTIWNVAVVDPATGGTHPAMLVEVEDGRIQAVEPAGENPPSAAETVVDGTGKFLMPGLWDNHVHLSKLGSSSLPLFVAHGVTSVRDMGSDLSEVLRWRRQIEAAARVGPRIKTPGQILESQANVTRMLRERTVEPVERLRMPMAGPEEARRAVKELLAAGADFIKVRTVPNRETFLALAEACRERDVRLAGHPVAPPEVLAQAGLASVEHALTLSPDSSATERNRLHNVVKRAGAYVGTTVSNDEGSVLIPYEEAVRRIETDPRMRFVGSYLLSDWREQAGEKNPPEARDMLETYRNLIPALYNELKELHAAGVPLLAGSDAAVLFAYPGSSLHAELESLVEDIGLTPAEALQSATTAPADFWGMSDHLGRVKPGHLADLVLLEADPLQSIANTRRVAGVVLAGKWFDRADLDGLTEAAEREARGGSQQ